jgi:ADP-ribose pyrophosphatase YjhB (NUDIX family)
LTARWETVDLVKAVPDDNSPVHADHRIQHQFPENVRFCALCGAVMRMRTVLPDHKRFKVCSGCGFIHFPGPKLVAGCLLIDRGRVLLLRRGIEPQIGKWTFPGGYVDLGESPAEAALRETREEVGMRVELGRVLGVYSDPAHPIAAVVAYLAKPGIEEASVTDEATEVRYFAPQDIPWHEIAFPTTHDALRDWLALLAMDRHA